ncbi:MAG: hypothetical protein V3V41_07860 [Candidatus Heimdallarchaeota archaeon]
MPSFKIVADLITLITSDFTFGNVTGLAVKPAIYINLDDDARGNIDDGYILLVDDYKTRPDPRGQSRNEHYFVEGELHYETGTQTAVNTTLAEMMIELDRLLQAADMMATAGNEYDFTVTVTGKDVDTIFFVIEAVKWLVAVL